MRLKLFPNQMERSKGSSIGPIPASEESDMARDNDEHYGTGRPAKQLAATIQLSARFIILEAR